MNDLLSDLEKSKKRANKRKRLLIIFKSTIPGYLLLIMILIGYSLLKSNIFDPNILPSSIRPYFIHAEYSLDDCLSSRKWALNPKQVIGIEKKKNRRGYLLKDLDKHEHIQFVSRLEVEAYAKKTLCPN